MKTKRRLSGQLRGGFYAGYRLDTITIPKQLAVVIVVLIVVADTTNVYPLKELF